MDRRYRGHATGVGNCRVLGRIPPHALQLSIQGQVFAAPSILILEHMQTKVELLLGLDFLRSTHATLNLSRHEMKLKQQQQQRQDGGRASSDLMVPFLSRHSQQTSSTQDGDDDDDVYRDEWNDSTSPAIDDDGADMSEDDYFQGSDHEGEIDMSGV